MNSSAMFRRLLLLTLFVAALSFSRSASAQPVRADTAAVLLAAAEDLENRGADDIAEALYRYILEHFQETSAAEAARIRIEVISSRRSQAGGEVELKVWMATYGVFMGGVVVPSALDSGDSRTVGLGLLVGGPAGFLAGRQMARTHPRSLGQTRAVTWGGTWGVIQGWGWAAVLDFGKRDPRSSGRAGEDESSQAIAASAFVGGALGIGSSLMLARRDITPGAATSAMLGSLWGMWLGFSTAYLMDVEGDGLTGASLAAGNAGLLAGALAGHRLPISRGQARMASLSGVIGGFCGLGLNLIIQPEGGKAVVGMMLASSIAGLAAGVIGVTRSNRRAKRGESDLSEGREAPAFLPVPGSLLNWSDGNWALSTPLPVPALQPIPQNDGRNALAWKVSLLKMQF